MSSRLLGQDALEHGTPLPLKPDVIEAAGRRRGRPDGQQAPAAAGEDKRELAAADLNQQEGCSDGACTTCQGLPLDSPLVGSDEPWRVSGRPGG